MATKQQTLINEQCCLLIAYNVTGFSMKHITFHMSSIGHGSTSTFLYSGFDLGIFADVSIFETGLRRFGLVIFAN